MRFAFELLVGSFTEDDRDLIVMVPRQLEFYGIFRGFFLVGSWVLGKFHPALEPEGREDGARQTRF